MIHLQRYKYLGFWSRVSNDNLILTRFFVTKSFWKIRGIWLGALFRNRIRMSDIRVIFCVTRLKCLFVTSKCDIFVRFFSYKKRLICYECYEKVPWIKCHTSFTQFLSQKTSTPQNPSELLLLLLLETAVVQTSFIPYFYHLSAAPYEIFTVPIRW